MLQIHTAAELLTPQLTMSLDQFITAVTTLSSQANYAELCDHLNKSQEVACQCF